jgi:hypothetical protein
VSADHCGRRRRAASDHGRGARREGRTNGRRAGEIRRPWRTASRAIGG